MSNKSVFNLVLEAARSIQGFNPSEKELEVLELAFDGLFKKRGNGLRKNPLSWTGFVETKIVNGEKVRIINEKMRDQCLQSAFGRMFFYHAGKLDAYLGTIIYATEKLGWIAYAYNLCDEKRGRYGSPEREENDKKAKHFADICDTFCQVFVYILKKGETSSIPAERWRKVFGC